MGKGVLLRYRAVVRYYHPYLAIICEQTRDVVLVGILEIQAFCVVRVIGFIFSDDILYYTPFK